MCIGSSYVGGSALLLAYRGFDKLNRRVVGVRFSAYGGFDKLNRRVVGVRFSAYGGFDKLNRRGSGSRRTEVSRRSLPSG